MKRCVSCGEEMRPSTTESWSHVKVGGELRRVLIEDIPCLKCPSCGAERISRENDAKIRKILFDPEEEEKWTEEKVLVRDFKKE